jgi:hypothetical protein
MRSTIAVLALALACGCQSPPPPVVEKGSEPAMPDLDKNLDWMLLFKKVNASFKGASLEVILSHFADQTQASFALDPRLCYAHGPPEFWVDDSLGRALHKLEKETPEVHVEYWRGVVFVSKDGEPLPIPQTPLASPGWHDCAARAKLDVNLVHTPLEEVAGFLEHAFAMTAGAHYDRFAYSVDDSIKDRQVTASFHDLPLDRAIDVICRLADAKLVETYADGAVFAFKPAREPIAPTPR